MLLFICDNPDILKVMKMVRAVITIIKIAVPIILIVSLMITVARAVVANGNDALSKELKNSATKIITAVLFFLIPTLVSAIFNIVGSKADYMACIKNATTENINLAYTKQAQEYLSNANDSLSRADYNKAQRLIDDLENEEDRYALQEQLDELDKKVTEKEQMDELQKNSGKSFIYPLKNYTASFTACFDGNDSVHNGSHGAVDLGAKFNTPIYASKGGKVVTSVSSHTQNHTSASGSCGGCGNYVVIDHQDGTKSTYCHMYPGKVFVSKGDIVTQGQLIGEVGSTGCSTGAHLHFAISVRGVPVDPVDYASFNVTNPNRCN